MKPKQTPAKMVTIKCLAVGRHKWDESPDEARIERNAFLRNGESWEALRFCKNRNGRQRVYAALQIFRQAENFVHRSHEHGHHDGVEANARAYG